MAINKDVNQVTETNAARSVDPKKVADVRGRTEQILPVPLPRRSVDTSSYGGLKDAFYRP